MKTSHQMAITLSQLSRKLFDKSSNIFYGSLLVESLIGILIPLAQRLEMSIEVKYVFSIISLALTLSIIVMKWWFNSLYDVAETMRKQAVFTEGLGWDLNESDYVDWVQLTGKKVITEVENSTRPENYFETKEKVGPKKILEMTIESNFFTRSLLLKMQRLILVVLIIFSGISLFVFNSIPLITTTRIAFLSFAGAFISVVPALISLDLVGIYIKLNRSCKALKNIELGMLQVYKTTPDDVERVLRYVSEYNSQMSNIIPIHNLFFDLWHTEIKKIWLKLKLW